MNFREALDLWFEENPARSYSEFEKLNQGQLNNFKAIIIKFFKENLNQAVPSMI